MDNKLEREIFAGRLKELRRRSGKSRKELAEKIGVQPQSIWRYETAKNWPNIDTLLAISAYFEINMAYFFR